MKKIMMLLLMGVLSLSFISCGANEEAANNASEEVVEEEVVVEEEEVVEEVKEPALEGTLEEIMDRLYSGVEFELPMLANTVIDSESVAYFLGTDELSYLEGVASEPMISSIAHSVVLLRVEESSDIEAMKASIKTSVDPRKWICVGVEEDEVIVDNIGDVVVLIMSHEAEGLHQSFVNLVE